MPRAIRQAVAAGVKCIEHGHLIDEPTAKLLADEGIWWSVQPFLDDEDVPAMSPESRKKVMQVFAGTDNAYRLAKKYKVKTAFGTDILFDARIASRQGAILAKMVRWYTPAEALEMANADNGELMALFRVYQSLSRKAWCRRRRGARGPAVGRRQSVRKHQARRRSGQKLRGHYEGRHSLQKHDVQVSTIVCRVNAYERTSSKAWRPRKTNMS